MQPYLKINERSGIEKKDHRFQHFADASISSKLHYSIFAIRYSLFIISIFAGDMYSFIRSIFFLFPAEGVHHFAMKAFKLANRLGFRKLLRSQFAPPDNLPTTAFGLKFRNPVGLGAGFDKNALYLDELETLGFGFVEIGTVTPLPQAGNDQPRLFRLPLDKALINRMGFNNDGVKVIAQRLKNWREDQITRTKNQITNKEEETLKKNNKHKTTNSKLPLVIGGNIGKNKVTPNEDAWKDYEICFRALFDVVDYFVVNVSSPNTPGLRELQEKGFLQKILSHLQVVNRQLSQDNNIDPKPLLLKIAPDLTPSQVNDVIDLSLEIKLDGLVASNTTVSRDNLVTSKHTLEQIGAGGLSGEPLKERSTEMVRYIARGTHGSIPIIASGGIFTAADAREKFAAGATLVQVWTGFIYEGPEIVGKILQKVNSQ